MLRGKAVTLTAIRMSQRAIGCGRYPGEQTGQDMRGLGPSGRPFPIFCPPYLGIASARFDKLTSKTHGSWKVLKTRSRLKKTFPARLGRYNRGLRSVWSHISRSRQRETFLSDLVGSVRLTRGRTRP
jgi:hypothetical protein